MQIKTLKTTFDQTPNTTKAHVDISKLSTLKQTLELHLKNVALQDP